MSRSEARQAALALLGTLVNLPRARSTVISR